MESWAIPLYHVGGAGLHYPRVGFDASSPPADWAAPGMVGPLPAQPATSYDASEGISSLAETEKVKVAGVEGEWFDANDVEEYAKTKGLYLNAGSKIVEFVEPPTTAASAHNIWEAAPPSNTLNIDGMMMPSLNESASHCLTQTSDLLTLGRWPSVSMLGKNNMAPQQHLPGPIDDIVQELFSGSKTLTKA